MIVPSGLLMIEPQGKATQPIIDELTRKVTAAWRNSTPSNGGYRGFHQCECGAQSDNYDHFVIVDGQKLLTNSLMVHYIACHRDQVPPAELKKAAALAYGEAEPTAEELMPRRYR